MSEMRNGYREVSSEPRPEQESETLRDTSVARERVRKALEAMLVTLAVAGPTAGHAAEKRPWEDHESGKTPDGLHVEYYRGIDPDAQQQGERGELTVTGVKVVDEGDPAVAGDETETEVVFGLFDVQHPDGTLVSYQDMDVHEKGQLCKGPFAYVTEAPTWARGVLKNKSGKKARAVLGRINRTFARLNTTMRAFAGVEAVGRVYESGGELSMEASMLAEEIENILAGLQEQFPDMPVPDEVRTFEKRYGAFMMVQE